MPMEDYPTYKDEGDEVYLSLLGRFKALGLEEREQPAIAAFLAAAYQKSLELQFLVNRLLTANMNDEAEVADLLATAEVAAGVLAQWHQESAAKLIAAVELLRSRTASKVAGNRAQER